MPLGRGGHKESPATWGGLAASAAYLVDLFEVFNRQLVTCAQLVEVDLLGLDDVREVWAVRPRLSPQVPQHTLEPAHGHKRARRCALRSRTVCERTGSRARRAQGREALHNCTTVDGFWWLSPQIVTAFPG